MAHIVVRQAVTQEERLDRLAVTVARIVELARSKQPDLWGCSPLDLVTDNIPDASLADLQLALEKAGIYPASPAREIADLMDGAEWSADTLNAIADILRRHGFEVNEVRDPDPEGTS